VDMAKEILARSRPCWRGWHDVYVRFGTQHDQRPSAPRPNPGKSCSSLGDKRYLLFPRPSARSGQTWEGDGGDTFLTGTKCVMNGRAAPKDARDACFNNSSRKEMGGRGRDRQGALHVRPRAKPPRWPGSFNLDLSGAPYLRFSRHAAVYDGPMADGAVCPSPPDLGAGDPYPVTQPSSMVRFFEDMLLGRRVF